MADVADRAQQDIELYQASLQTAYEIPPGNPGVCVECDEPSPRLINGLCAVCRDLRARSHPRR